MELLELLLPIVIPVAIGIASAVFGQLFLASRRLRSELAVDSQIVDRLPDGVRQELSEQIRRRAYLLVAYSRYPTLTRPEILALLAVLLITAVGVALASNVTEPNQNPLIAIGILVGLVVASWVYYLDSWVPRTVHRVAYVQQRLGGEQAEESVGVLRVAWWVMMLGGLACVLTLPMDLFGGVLSRRWARPVSRTGAPA